MGAAMRAGRRSDLVYVQYFGVHDAWKERRASMRGTKWGHQGMSVSKAGV